MKKIFYFIITSLAFCFCLTNVNAENAYFTWHNSMDNAYTTNYDGMISNESGKYQNGSIESLDGYNIKLNNFNAYDVMVTSSSTWNINGNNTINSIEEGTNSIITLTGTGSLKFKTIGLSMTDMLDTNTDNLEVRIKTYLKGDYNLNREGQYIVVKLNTPKEEKPIKEEKPVNNDNNEKKEETPSNEDVHENENQKEINFENKELGIFLISSSKVPENTMFVAKNITNDKKAEITEKLNSKEQIKYIYDLVLLSNEKEIEPNEEVEVKIKLEESNYNIYYYNDKKKLEHIDSEYKDEHLVFKTNHFSNYVITEEKETESNNTTAKTKNNNNLTIVGCILLVSIIVIVSFIIIKKKKTKKI